MSGRSISMMMMLLMMMLMVMLTMVGSPGRPNPVSRVSNGCARINMWLPQWVDHRVRRLENLNDNTSFVISGCHCPLATTL